MKDARALGVRLAIDDFGATFASLTLLDDLEPNQIKLDMRLIRGVDRGGSRQAILRAIRRACYDLKIDVIAEGVETLAEYRFLIGQRVRLFQGYLFAKPAFEAFPPAHFPESSIGEAPKPPARATTSRASSRHLSRSGHRVPPANTRPTSGSAYPPPIHHALAANFGISHALKHCSQAPQPTPTAFRRNSQ